MVLFAENEQKHHHPDCSFYTIMLNKLPQAKSGQSLATITSYMSLTDLAHKWQ